MAWLGSWSKRIKITIDNSNIDSDLDHFPHLVKLGTSVGQSNEDVSAVFDEVGSNWQKIAVTDSTGDTQLYVEKEKWNSTTEEASLWISKSGWTISSGSTTDIYLYFDNSQSDNTSYVAEAGSRTEVWNSDVFARFGNQDDPSGTSPQMTDSSSNNNDGSTTGSMTSSDLVDSPEGKGIQGDGNDDYVNLGDLTKPDYATHEFYFQSLDNGKTQRFAGDEGVGDGAGTAIFKTSDGTVYFGSAFGGNWNKIETSANVNDTNWHHLVFAYDGSNLDVYLDGSLQSSDSESGALGDQAKDFVYMWCTDQSTSDRFDGIFGEYRWYSKGISSAWQKADYHSITDNLNTFGSVETGATVASGNIVSVLSSILSGVPTTSTTAGSSIVNVTSSSLEAKLAGTTALGTLVNVNSSSLSGTGLIGITGSANIVNVNASSLTADALLTILGSGDIVNVNSNSLSGDVYLGLTGSGDLVVVSSSSINGTVGTGRRVVAKGEPNTATFTGRNFNKVEKVEKTDRLATLI